MQDLDYLKGQLDMVNSIIDHVRSGYIVSDPSTVDNLLSYLTYHQHTLSKHIQDPCTEFLEEGD